MLWKKWCWILGFMGFCVLGASGQADSQRAVLAALVEDMRLLTQKVGSLELEVEGLRRENTRLQREIAQTRQNAASADRNREIVTMVEARAEAIRREFRQADAEQRTAIIAEVTRQIQQLASETQKGMNALAEAINATPNVPTRHQFSDDFPSTGVLYTVRSGDTLSGIARAHGATVRDIQNANRIANPNALQVGREIVIPIRE